MTGKRIAGTSSLQDWIKELRGRRKKQKKALDRPKRKPLNKAERVTILKFTDRKCHICGGDIDGRWQADHVRAHSAGGKHALDNYLPAHSTCNNYRWDYLPEEIELILKMGVWAKTQVERGTKVGREIERRFTNYEKARFARRSKSKRDV